jgi:paraquat-inducible protein B
VGVEGSPLTAASGGAGAAVGPGDLMLVLRGDRARSVNAGSPVLFRGVKVGHVLNWDLDPTGRSVDVHVAVYERYAHLVRANSRWWSVSGFGFDFGLVGGLSLRTSSLESLISGGVSFATPERPSPGARAMNGQVFELVPEAEKDWLEWSPDRARSGSNGRAIGFRMRRHP